MNVMRALSVVILFCAAMASLAPAAGPTTKPKTEAELLAEQLSDKDPVVAREAIVRVRELLETEPTKAVTELRSRWLKALVAAKRYEDVAELALSGILLQPANTANVYALQEARVRALLAMGKKQEALSNAKGLFNVAPMNNTADAMLLVAECLRANDPDSADRFREEQIAGATTQPVTTQPATQAALKTSAVLAGIKVDPKAYEEAIKNQYREDYSSFVAQGNLLLLADKPKEAKAAFERAYALAPDNQLAQATENIARAIKAEDGTIGRANGWILSLKPAK